MFKDVLKKILFILIAVIFVICLIFVVVSDITGFTQVMYHWSPGDYGIDTFAELIKSHFT